MKTKRANMKSWLIGWYQFLLHSQKQTKNVADFKIYLAYIENFYKKTSLR